MKKKIIGGILLGILTLSCNDFLNQEPENMVTNSNFWKTEKDVESAVYNMYSIFRTTYGSSSAIILRDRGLPFDYISSTYVNMAENDLIKSCKSNSPRINWAPDYKLIAAANSIIDNIHRVDLSQKRYNFYLGQAFCIRGFAYSYILKAWGDAPLVERSEDVGIKKRESWLILADVARKDLKKAIELLPLASQLKNADGTIITSKQTPSKGTAYAILAHLEAWIAALNHQPELNREAIRAADAVINSGEYELANDPKEVCEKVLLGNSKEGILEIEYRDNIGDFKGTGYIADFCQTWPIKPLATPATKRRDMRISNSAVMQMFPDKSDKRRDEYFYKLDSMATVSTSITQGAAYIQKWRHVVKHVGGNQDGKYKGYEDNEILIRLADIILLRAELREKTGDISGAIEDLNTIRRRAGALPYSSAEGELKDAIAKEREKELFLEGLQLRYFDIVRNGTYREKLIGAFKTLTSEDVSEGALYLPIAIRAFYNNTQMVQTPYWKRHGYAY